MNLLCTINILQSFNYCSIVLFLSLSHLAFYIGPATRTALRIAVSLTATSAVFSACADVAALVLLDRIYPPHAGGPEESPALPRGHRL